MALCKQNDLTFFPVKRIIKSIIYEFFSFVNNIFGFFDDSFFLYGCFHVLFCTNRKERKESQAFRLIEARLLHLSEIGSPHGFCINKFMQPSAGIGYGTSRRNNRRTKADTYNFMYDDVLVPFGKH